MKPMLLVLLAMAVAAPLAAQAPDLQPLGAERSPLPSWWVNTGVSGLRSPLGVGLSASVSRRRGARTLRLGYDQAADIKDVVTMKAISLSVGAERRAGPLRFTALAGPAFVWGGNDVSVTQLEIPETYSTFGATIDVSALVGLGSRVAVGARAWTIVNSQLNAFGVGPTLHLRLR